MGGSLPVLCQSIYDATIWRINNIMGQGFRKWLKTGLATTLRRSLLARGAGCRLENALVPNGQNGPGMRFGSRCAIAIRTGRTSPPSFIEARGGLERTDRTIIVLNGTIASLSAIGR